MVVKSDTENKIPFSILPPTVTAPENDAFSAKIATIQKNLRKKQEPPRFLGGILDIDDDKMDTTESNSDSVRRQLKYMLESEDPYFDIDDHKMDAIETCSSESLSFLSPSFLEEPGVREMDVTEAKVPSVVKKKSMNELSLERSKRCRTSSKTEVEFSQADMLKESHPVQGANAGPLPLKVENSLLPQKYDLNSTICQESEIAINDNNVQKSEVGLMIKTQNSYQKEIDALRKVALIFESLANNTSQQHKSYSEEVGHLQRICHVLKNLENSYPPASETLEVNKSVASGDLVGEAAFTFNDIHHNENQSTELSNRVEDNLQPMISEGLGSSIQDPCASASLVFEKSKSRRCDSSVDSNKKSDLVLVNNTEVLLGKNSETEAICSENRSSSLEQIVNGTLKWKPTGRPPSATAFSVGSVPNVMNSSIQQSSMSSTNDTLLETSANEMLQLKATSEPSCGGALETDDVFEILKNAASRGSPPPMPAFGKLATTSPSRTVDKSSLNTQDAPLPIEAVTMMKDAVPPSSPPKYIPPHLRSSNNAVSENSREAQDFRPEPKASHNHFKTSSKTRDAYSPYQAKEHKGTKIKDPVKSNMNAAVLPSSSYRNLPPRLKQKSPALKSDDISKKQTQNVKTEARSNWRKVDSPPELNDLSSSSRHSPVYDNYTKLQPKDEKVLNLNVEMDSSSSRSSPSEYFDSSKLNHTAKVSGRRQLPNERKVSNIDVKREKSAYGAQLSEDAKITLKIFDEQNAMVDELTLTLSELVQRRKYFPTLSEVIPSTGEKDKVLLMSGSAVKVFLRCVFSAQLLIIPGWEIALEAYYMAKKYGIVKLQAQCKDYFDFKSIHSSQVQRIVQIARKFQITEVLKNSMMFAEVQAHSIPGSTVPAVIKEEWCTVSCMVSAEPSEYCVPIYYVKESGLGSRIESDIKNDIIFEAKCGTFCLAGLQIKLEAENSDLQKEVSILCDVYKSNEKVFDLERAKPLSKLMIIYFKQKLLVVPGEIVTISVIMEDACMRMCHCLTKEKVFGRCGDGRFEISFESDRKSEAKQPLFFVEKLLYTFEGRKN